MYVATVEGVTSIRAVLIIALELRALGVIDDTAVQMPSHDVLDFG